MFKVMRFSLGKFNKGQSIYSGTARECLEFLKALFLVRKEEGYQVLREKRLFILQHDQLTYAKYYKLVRY